MPNVWRRRRTLGSGIPSWIWDLIGNYHDVGNNPDHVAMVPTGTVSLGNTSFNPSGAAHIGDGAVNSYLQASGMTIDPSNGLTMVCAVKYDTFTSSPTFIACVGTGTNFIALYSQSGEGRGYIQIGGVSAYGYYAGSMPDNTPRVVAARYYPPVGALNGGIKFDCFYNDHDAPVGSPATISGLAALAPMSLVTVGNYIAPATGYNNPGLYEGCRIYGAALSDTDLEAQVVQLFNR